MTALTVAQLDAAPKGSRLIYRHGRVTVVLIRTLVGWVADDECPSPSVSSTLALDGSRVGYIESIRLLPPAAPVKVIGETARNEHFSEAAWLEHFVSAPILWWRWQCQVAGCDEASTSYFDSNLVHTMARTHAKAHAAIGRAA